MKVNFINFLDSKDHRHFLLIGNELVLKQEVTNSILNTLEKNGFKERITLYQDDMDQMQEIISKNLGGSLFQENLIIHIKHASGKFPEKIKSILENENIYQAQSISIIIDSCIEKTPASGEWIKSFDCNGVIISCVKLKQAEEKMWLKRQLEFLPKDLLPLFGGSIFQNNESNLLGQKNEVALLKLLFLSHENAQNIETDHIIFGTGISAFELEDLLITRNFKKALVTINYMRDHDRQNSAPIIWIIAKVINSCLNSLQATNQNSALTNNGVWASKIKYYKDLIKKAETEEFMSLNKEILKIDLINKGILKAETWEQIERVMLMLQDATSLQN